MDPITTARFATALMLGAATTAVSLYAVATQHALRMADAWLGLAEDLVDDSCVWRCVEQIVDTAPKFYGLEAA